MTIEEFDRKRHDTRTVSDLLAMAIGASTPEKLQKLLDVFYSEDGHVIFVSLDGNTITGVIGLDYTATPHGWITHLAVRPELRKQGIGRRLIEHLADRVGLESIGLETDQDAVGFYRACAFEVKEIPSQWPGVRRFRCFKSMIDKQNEKTGLLPT
jgi:ribosomal protein S18 acetylase RimI-like enzyme